MSDKKYQVFISSTYEDLKEERKAVEQTIIRCGDFPVGMEAFPAADEEQFEFIKAIISQCDYYVLIIAGRYGSLDPDGKSYTEKEYDYAVEIGVPVLVMLREKRDELPANRTEADPQKRTKLEEFVAAASNGRLHKKWATTDGLKLAIREALDYAKATKARPGWIRGDQSASTETLEKLVKLQQENENLRKDLKTVEFQFQPPQNIAGLNTKITIEGSYSYSIHYGTKQENFSIDTDFGEIFEGVSPHLILAKIDSAIPHLIGNSIFNRHRPESKGRKNFHIQDGIFQKIKVQLMALNLVTVKPTETVSGGVQLFWRLTDLGEREMTDLIVIKSK